MPFPNLDGRPSEYTNKVIPKIAEFVNQRLEEKRLPTRAGLANYIGTSKATLIKWSREHEQLLNALEVFDQIQEDDVWDKALKGEYNSNIAKFLLMNHGYSDKSEVKSETKSEVKQETTISLDERLNKALEDLKDTQTHDHE